MRDEVLVWLTAIPLLGTCIAIVLGGMADAEDSREEKHEEDRSFD